MAKLQRKTISRRTVVALRVDKDMVFWDRDLPQFVMQDISKADHLG